MACGCKGSKTSTGTAAAPTQASFVVSSGDGRTRRYNTEAEARAAIAQRGNGRLTVEK